MPLLHIANEEKKLDVRIVDRNVRKGSLTAEEVQKQLQALPDDSENAEWVNVEELAKLDDVK
jgi:hypothetical protein